MKRNILIWPVHGSYLHALGNIQQNWLVPVDSCPSREFAPWIQPISENELRHYPIDAIIAQSPRNLHVDGPALLGSRFAEIPCIFLEHNTPREHPYLTRHPAADSSCLLVHVTNFNRLMWDNGTADVRVIEHSVAVGNDVAWTGLRPAGITVVNDMPSRGRLVGLDLFLEARNSLELDLAGIDSQRLGGLGDIPYASLPSIMADYRFLFSPMRHTSLPLAVVEAMTIGMPVVTLATTELPSLIENGVNGFCSNDLSVLIEDMQRLRNDHALARRLGDAARVTAQQRFAFDRFSNDWIETIEQAIERGALSPVERSHFHQPVGAPS